METSQQNNFKLDFQKSIAHKLSEEEKEKKKKDKFKLKNNTLSKKKKQHNQFQQFKLKNRLNFHKSYKKESRNALFSLTDLSCAFIYRFCA